MAVVFNTLHRCRVAAAFPKEDVAVLELVERIKGEVRKIPKEFPAVSTKRISMGASIGFLARLELPDPEKGRTSRAYLASGMASMLLPPDEERNHRFVLTNALVQKGFSGSVAFRTDGSIVGVVVESFQFFTDPDNPLVAVTQLPVVSPTFSIAEDLMAFQDGQ